jgi:uncharacterized protein (DUF169 family)
MSSQYESIARTLSDTLDLRLPPIAVCFAESVPAGVPLVRQPAPAGCAFWERAATGAFATSAPDHEACAIGTFTHNLATTPAHEVDRADALKVFADLGYVRPEDVPRIPFLATRPQHIIYAPLAAAPLSPDVVLLFVRAGQALILAEASDSLEAGLPPAMGRPACAVVPQAINTGRAALSLGCCGARTYLEALAEDVALYAIPGTRLAAYAQRVSELGRANRVLTRFHRVRKQDIEAGRRPTIKESLARMSDGSG